MSHASHDIGVARQIGTYIDAVEAAPGARWLMISGTPGLGADGALPGDIVGQAEIAWSHILTILGQAGMGIHDVVKINQYLLRASDIPAYAKVRAKFLGQARPASTLLVVPALARPDFLIEVEACAAKV
jgi:2-iminobutanoate/2-iminopropanoate deaminase